MKRKMTQVVSLATLLMVLVLPELHPQASPTLDSTAQMLAELTNAFGPPGQEEEVAVVFMRYIKPYVDEIRRDGMGNVIAIKKGTAEGPRVMLTAHLDEVGFLVKYIDEKGFIRYQPLGGVVEPGTARAYRENPDSQQGRCQGNLRIQATASAGSGTTESGR